MVQTTLWYVENKGLFSNHYLENQLLMLDEWKEPNNIEEIFSKIKALYRSKQSLFPNAKESQLREEFLNPVLKYLGQHYQVEGKIEGFGVPDYGLFPDGKSADEAIKYQGTENFYKKAIAICEAKAWEIKLDERDPKNPEQDKRPPNSQIDEYLRWSEKKWGILTNGRFWRLYYRENSYRNYFYQVDLSEIIEKDDVKAFKYFFLFFRKEAFDVDVNKLCFLDRVYQGSVDYAKDIGENLEENVYKAMKTLAEGFINWAESNLTKTEEDLKVIQENTMKFLYRLLFIFFAEAKGLLDISQKTSASKNYAEHYSLDSLKKKIKNRIKSGEDIPAYLDSYYNQLQTLFNFIDKGTEASNIPKEKLYIPSYNGGLFDAEKNKFLSEKKIGDYYLAKAIDLLASTEGKKPEEKGFIDYSSLDIRHLGSIYEGLLEYTLKVAEQDIVTKGNEWVILEKYNEDRKQKKSFEDFDEFEHTRNGELYLATDKGERKATGSYYTPEYIVKYIVENTLTPVVKEKMNKAIQKGEKCSDAILSIKVLDPAMGSGHFLVEAVDFLGRRLDDAINEDIKRGLLKEWKYSDDWLRREIVSHCIYGVDLNLMAVELAKVSLWLKTISKDKPLSFLDHRLKCGNSLIGAKLADLKEYPEIKKKEKKDTTLPSFVSQIFIDKLIGKIKELEQISDEKIDDIKKKEKIFQDFKELDAYKKTKAIADVHTSIYFGNKVAPTQQKDEKNVYYDLIYSLQYPSNWEPKTKTEWFKNAQKIAENKYFFHWELEFPEIFFEEGKLKENPGFDAVVGNPPYIQLSMDDAVRNLMQDFLITRFTFSMGRLNTFGFFTRLGLELSNLCGFVSMIVPNTLLTMPYYADFREYILNSTEIKSLLTFDSLPFQDAIVENTVFVFRKSGDVTKLATHKIEIYEIANILSGFTNPSRLIPQNQYHKLFEKAFNPYLTELIIKLFEKISSVGTVLLNELVDINQAIALKHDRAKYLVSKPEGVQYKKVLDGRDINRYLLDFPGTYLRYEKEAIHSCKTEEIFLTSGKLFFRRVGKRIIATFDDEQYYALNTLVVINAKNELLNLRFLLSLLNSNLLNWYYSTFLKSTKEVFSEIQARQMEQLPIRRISFTTPKEELEKLVADLKQKYQDEKFDESLKTIEECLPKDKDGNFITEKEKSDVIHDFLAFLAEQLIEMNKQKQSEIRGFTDWLEGYCKVKIDELTSRTKLQAYYKCDWNEIKDVLAKNKKKIAEFDITRREPLERINGEYDISIKKLRPLLQKIEATDNLIDQIVYKLYGLTDDEIKIVEQSVSKKEMSTSENEN